MRVAVFDIDGVLADCRHRLHFAEEKDYDRFYGDSYMAGDECILAGFELMLSFIKQGYMIAFVTGRPERTRKITQEWLKMYMPDDLHYAIANVFMRKDGDYRPSPIVKEELMANVFAKFPECEDGWFIDDDPENVKAICNDFQFVTGIVFGIS